MKPTKIIAGLEPTQTNLLLQAIGKAIDRKLDSSKYVQKLNAGTVKNLQKVKSEIKTRQDKVTNSKSTDVEKKIKKGTKTKQKTQSHNEKIHTPKSTRDADKEHKKELKTKKNLDSSVIEINASNNAESINSVLEEHQQHTAEIGDSEINKKTEETILNNEHPEILHEDGKQLEDNLNMPDNINNTHPTNAEPADNLQIDVDEKIMERPKTARPKSGVFRQNKISMANTEASNEDNFSTNGKQSINY